MSRNFRRNKFGAKKTNCAGGHTHDSKKEAKRCDELHLLLRAGEIAELEQQPQFWFAIHGQQLKHKNGRRVGYCGDFQYREGDRMVVEEVKGFAARDWPLRAAVFRALYPEIELREV